MLNFDPFFSTVTKNECTTLSFRKNTHLSAHVDWPLNGTTRTSCDAATKICNCSFLLSMYYKANKLRFPQDTSGIMGRNRPHFQHSLCSLERAFGHRIIHVATYLFSALYTLFTKNLLCIYLQFFSTEIGCYVK